jgi:hypothetical protein
MVITDSHSQASNLLECRSEQIRGAVKEKLQR